MTPPAVLAPLRRAGALLAVLLGLAAASAWLTPFVTPGGQGFPFGCGSLAHPNGSPLAGQVCTVAVQAHQVRALFLLMATVAVAGVTVGLAARTTAWTVGALAAIPVLAAGLVLLLSPLQVRGLDGSAMACGRPIAPATDHFAGGLCSDVPGARLGEGLTLVMVALVLGVGLPWALGSGPGPLRRSPRPDGAGPGTTVIDLRDEPASSPPGSPSPSPSPPPPPEPERS